MANALNDQNFKEFISKSKKPVLVDFWASWCVPCSTLAPILEKAVADFSDKIEFAKVNIDEAQILAQALKIDRIPAVILFKDGNPVHGFIGVMPEQEVKNWLEKVLAGSDEKIVELIKGYEDYAKKSGFSVNPDKESVEKLARGLLANEQKHGAKYCPCRRVTGDKEEDKGKICPCQWHKEEIEKGGRCLCGLFVK